MFVAQIIIECGWASQHNLVPWQLSGQKARAVLRFGNLTPDETFDLEHLKERLSERIKIVSLFHASNILGAFENFTSYDDHDSQISRGLCEWFDKGMPEFFACNRMYEPYCLI